MNAAHEPSMDDILKSIRRIIRSDQDEANQEKTESMEIVAKPRVNAAVKKEEVVKEDNNNLIRMKIHDQKRLRILEKKLQTIEAEYEQKLQLHRRKMTDYRRQNEELVAAVDAYRSKLELMSDSLKTAHDCLEKLQVKNKALNDKMVQLSRQEQGTAVLKAIQREFTNLYHPDRAKGDNFSRLVRHEVYNEFNQILQGVRNRVESQHH